MGDVQKIVSQQSLEENKMELVSIVVPIYGVEEYLDKCIKSLINQTYHNLEVILVDDGSPDRCGQMCDMYANEDDRIKVIHKENGGLSDARNTGAKLASGKYLIFVDSDDYVDEKLVEKTVFAAEETCADMVIFDFTAVEKREFELRTSDVPANRLLRLDEEKGLLLMPPAAWSRLFNREFYMKAKHPFPVGKYYEDLGTTPKFLLEAGRIVYLKESLYFYNIRSNSIMKSSDFERNYRDKVWILNDILRFYKERNQFERYKEELEYLIFANGYFEPSREIVLKDRKNPYLKKFRTYMYTKFPEFHHNSYVKQLGKKNKLHLFILDIRQYWIMSLLSICRQFVERKRK